MNRFIHAPYESLTPFDQRAHMFRVDVEFATYMYHHGHFEKDFEAKLDPQPSHGPQD